MSWDSFDEVGCGAAVECHLSAADFALQKLLEPLRKGPTLDPSKLGQEPAWRHSKFVWAAVYGEGPPEVMDELRFARRTIGAVLIPDSCDQCRAESDGLLRCSGCRVTRYCGRDCQRAAWKRHRDICMEWS
ncbi:hypothetical protein DFJ74DRAFT_709594 [Hyaloraphidium curvatum]|nr:hypothetical protein DFJ74DRAFT_709594 [Hyaloraphidium curvatum]